MHFFRHRSAETEKTVWWTESENLSGSHSSTPPPHSLASTIIVLRRVHQTFRARRRLTASSHSSVFVRNRPRCDVEHVQINATQRARNPDREWAAADWPRSGVVLLVSYSSPACGEHSNKLNGTKRRTKATTIVCVCRWESKRNLWKKCGGMNRNKKKHRNCYTTMKLLRGAE